MPNPTIKEVAQLAKVSPMAVSLAIRNKPGVSEATRRRILDAAQQLGYRRNPYVSALMARIREGRQPEEQPVIAYINFHPGYVENDPESSGPYIPAAQERCKQLGFRLSVFPGNQPDLKPARLSQILYARGIQGVIVGPAFGMRGRLDLNWSRFATALIGYSIQHPPLHRAVNHQSHTARLAFQALSKLGYRQIGLVTDRKDERRVNFNWVAGWAAFYYEKSRIPPAPVFSADKKNSTAPSKLLQWIRQHRIDAIVSANTTAYHWLSQAGLKVPEDIAYAVCNRAAGNSSRMAISGINQNSGVVAREAVNLVVEQLLHNEIGVPDIAKTVMVEGFWMQGTSSPAVGTRRRSLEASAKDPTSR